MTIYISAVIPPFLCDSDKNNYKYSNPYLNYFCANNFSLNFAPCRLKQLTLTSANDVHYAQLNTSVSTMSCNWYEQAP